MKTTEPFIPSRPDLSEVELLREVTIANPRLCDAGLGIGSLWRSERKTVEQRQAEFDKDRAELLNPSDITVAQFAAVRGWLRKWPKTKHINHRNGTSYGLKHVAESSVGYSTNGVFIAAAYAEGFISELPDDTEKLNLCLNIPAKAWEHVAGTERAF
jgi:hypothetical protein